MSLAKKKWCLHGKNAYKVCVCNSWNLKKKKYKDVCEDEDIINTNRKLVNNDKNIDKKIFYKQFPIKIAIKNLHQ